MSDPTENSDELVLKEWYEPKTFLIAMVAGIKDMWLHAPVPLAVMVVLLFSSLRYSKNVMLEYDLEIEGLRMSRRESSSTEVST